MQYQQQRRRRKQQRRVAQQSTHGPRAYNLGLHMGQRRSVPALDDTWRTEMKRTFSDQRQLRVAMFLLHFPATLCGAEAGRHNTIMSSVLASPLYLVNSRFVCLFSLILTAVIFSVNSSLSCKYSRSSSVGLLHEVCTTL